MREVFLMSEVPLYHHLKLDTSHSVGYEGFGFPEIRRKLEPLYLSKYPKAKYAMHVDF